MPRRTQPRNGKKFGEVVADQFPDLSRHALDRIYSGKSLFVSRHKLRPEFQPPEYARLVLIRARICFSKLSGFKPKRFKLTADEKELINSVIEPKRKKDVK